MSPMAVPFIVKEHNPVLTGVLLAVIAVAFACVLYWMFHHEHKHRVRRKKGESPTPGDTAITKSSRNFL